MERFGHGDRGMERSRAGEVQLTVSQQQPSHTEHTWQAGSSSPSARAAGVRPRVGGKFLFLGDQKLYLRGVTYGTFRPNERGVDYPEPATVERDFSQMAAAGINSLRTYTIPPRWLLDIAELHGLFVMVGLAWEQHVAFLDHGGRPREIDRRVRDGVGSCAGHPAVLAYAIGNEIPAPVVRWHGRRRVERYLRRLYAAAKDEDPTALVTYVNYPPTEYLELPFLDFLCFNVYLEAQERLEAYLARLHNVAHDKPLVMAEIGLDSRRHGTEAQGRSLRWQVETAFRAGCAGAFVFAWTDEWYVTYLGENGRGVGGMDVEDWDFGLTDRRRRQKPALRAVRRAFAELPFPRGLDWPRVSVVICTHNGERTLRDCLEGLCALEYSNFEVIVVDDGSTDATAVIAEQYPFRVISTENRGLSNARNTGMKAASGQIVAYIDDDARPDPHWLAYLAASFLATSHVGIGGPNVTPQGEGVVAECVANAPGGPTHVLLSDTEAEHLPGCNMAFRKSALEAVGGFDPGFRVAGDDVDICWRLRDRGWTLGFSPAAMVWHHRRASLRAYWRQQRAYGKAEALLEQKWPERYDAAGHLAWAGRLYGKGLVSALARRRGRIYHGTWCSALFQSVYEQAPGVLGSLSSVPEWYLVIGLLGSLSALGVIWSPLLLCLPLLVAAFGALAAQAAAGAATASFPGRSRLRSGRRLLTALLYLLQPLARLRGRARHGLTPWRRRALAGLSLPVPRTHTLWSERWHSADERLREIEAALREDGVPVARGGHFDDWDLEARGGMLGSTRLRMLSEEHGAGRQFVRFHFYPRWSRLGLAVALFGALAAAAALDAAWPVAVILGVGTLALIVRALQECAGTTAELLIALERRRASPSPLPVTLEPTRAERTS
jgi:GT2 family glycosyltransferase